MTILVFLEHHEKSISKATLATISAALAAKSAHQYSKVIGLFLGADEVEQAAKEASHYGLDEVVYVQSESLRTYLALPYASLLATVINDIQPTLVLGLASSLGKDLMPRVAQHLDAGQASDVIAFMENQLFQRPMFAGNILAQVLIASEKKVATIRGASFEPALRTSAISAVRRLQIQPDAPPGQEFVSFDSVKSERPELSEAEIIVSGGRALKSAENFEKYILPLADALGAAVGASRAAVDAGYAPNDWQVGQTGKIVAPRLYFAIGISGAIQHLAGMKDSKVIVAINKDAQAPIFEIADYGLIGDIFEILPELTKEIRKLKTTQ